MRQSPKKPKPLSPEEIQRRNLAKTLGKLKTKVAEREEVWLDFFGQMIGEVMEGGMRLEEMLGKVRDAGLVADEMLETYEERWGKCD